MHLSLQLPKWQHLHISDGAKPHITFCNKLGLLRLRTVVWGGGSSASPHCFLELKQPCGSVVILSQIGLLQTFKIPFLAVAVWLQGNIGLDPG